MDVAVPSYSALFACSTDCEVMAAPAVSPSAGDELRSPFLNLNSGAWKFGERNDIALFGTKSLRMVKRLQPHDGVTLQ